MSVCWDILCSAALLTRPVLAESRHLTLLDVCMYGCGFRAHQLSLQSTVIAQYSTEGQPPSAALASKLNVPQGKRN